MCSPAVTLVSASADKPAQIRNTFLGSRIYEGVASGEVTAFAENVQTCEDDPCGTTVTFMATTQGDADDSESGAGQTCIDGDLGVYCACYDATVTGQEVSGVLSLPRHFLTCEVFEQFVE